MLGHLSRISWVSLVVGLSAAVGCSVNTEGQGAAERDDAGGSLGGTGGGGGVSGQTASGGSAGASGMSGSGGQAGGAGDASTGGSAGDTGAACGDERTCVPSVPSGWSGYYRLHGQDNVDEPEAGPKCADGSTPERFFTSPTDAACSPCTCGTLENASCGLPTVACSTADTSCTAANLSDWTSIWADGKCHKKDNPSKLSCIPTPGVVTAAGSCPPSTSTFSNPMFRGLTDVCDEPVTTGTCPNGQSCIRGGEAPYVGYVCVRKDGDNPCPNDFTSVRVMTYTGGDDERSCAACACAPVTSCTGGGIRFWDGNACDTPAIGGDDPISGSAGTCTNASKLLDTGSWSAELIASSAGGRCTPSGGAPAGQVSVQGAVTYCCH
ncbi:MAG: hypothetical protein OZ921_13945 [Sorangiineae bacterium]|nr:hypothetical protein [Polyangiaceae bacterium]MEB2323610.1 hypothetical protein [Sorangiineae bacterium]